MVRTPGAPARGTGVATGVAGLARVPAARTASAQTWLWVHLATLVAGIPVLVWINRDQWFAGDEWKVVTTNGLGSNPVRASIFAPHFEHWTTLGILVYKALYGVFALRSYWPYVAVLIAVTLAVAHMMWRLLLRIGVGPAYATGVAALTMVLAVSWENRSTAFQMVIIAPVALGFGALLLMPERGSWQRRDAGVAALLLVGLACSGVGITMAGVVAVAALLRRGWRVTLGIVAVPAAVYGLWYALQGTTGQRKTASFSTTVDHLPGFVWRGLTAAFSGLTRLDGTGAIVIAVVAVWLVWTVWRAGPRREPWPLVIATTVGVVLSIALTGLRRALSAPQSRYSDIVVLLALPALALMTQAAGRALIRRFGRPAVAACSALVIAFLVVQVVALNREVEGEPFVGEMRPRVLATARIMRDREPLASTNIFAIPFLDEPSATTIARLDRHGELPALDVSTADVLTAREYVELLVAGPPEQPEGVARLVEVSGGTAAPADPGCVTLEPHRSRAHPRALVALPTAGAIRVSTDRAEPASLSFVEGDAAGRPREFVTTPGDGTRLEVSRKTDVELRLASGVTSTICGLAAGTGNG